MKLHFGAKSDSKKNEKKKKTSPTKKYVAQRKRIVLKSCFGKNQFKIWLKIKMWSAKVGEKKKKNISISTR